MPQLNAIGIVASDLGRSIRFYRLLGLEVPETPDEAHIDTFLPNGVRLMLDTEDTVRSFDPEWSRATGNQLALAFECAGPNLEPRPVVRHEESRFRRASSRRRPLRSLQSGAPPVTRTDRCG